MKAQHLSILLSVLLWSCITLADPAKLLPVSGDRQIIVGGGLLPAPIVTRVVDAAGQPVQGVLVLTGPLAAQRLGPIAFDEFGFRGFNVIGDPVDYSYPAPQMAFSDADGLTFGRTAGGGNTPSSFLLGAVVLEGAKNSTTVPQVLFSLVRLTWQPQGSPVVAVEFFNTDVRHYFLTASAAEVAALTDGAFAGWTRSVGSFAVYPDRQSAAMGAVPVCRFFSALYTSHFYTADPAECDAVIAKWSDVWTLETREAFFVMPLDPQTGKCPETYQPVYRLYNTRNGPSHRYVTDVLVREAMAVAGWTREGAGQDIAVFCANG